MEDKIKILIIEDNPADVKLINIYLEEYFGDKFIFTNSDYLSKGLEFLSQSIFDIVILDLTLPDSSGLATFETIHEHSPNIPIIVLTGLDDESVGINAMKLGAQDFLVKGSIKGRELSRSISYSIERFKLLKDLSENAKILEKKTLELIKEEQKLSEAQQLSHIGSWDWDIIPDTVVWSDELYRIYNLDPNKKGISCEKIVKIVHPADKANAKRIMSEAKHNPQPFSFFYRIVISEDLIKTIQVRGKVIVDDEGKAIKMNGTAQDVTDQIQKEELEKLVLATTQSLNSVVIYNKNQQIEWINEGFVKLTGYTFNELKTNSIQILKGGKQKEIEKQQNVLKNVCSTKKPYSYENIIHSKQGEKYWVLTTATPILGKDGEVERIISIESDISLRKMMEEELLNATKLSENAVIKVNKTLEELTKAKKEVEESMKIKGKFMANMSHEIRTPMNAIVGFTELLLKTKLSQEQKQFINAVKTSGKNLLTIINDILDFSKIESGKMKFEKIEFNLSSIVSTVAKLMQPKAAEKNIQLITKISKDVPINLIGDPTRLNQILLNLVGNAIKFTNKGKVEIQVKLQSDLGEFVKLQFDIIDTGIGIPKSKLPTLFEAFTQVSNETTRKYGGTGLGLSIVKQLIELQDGNISVKSKANLGSTFTFTIKFRKNIELSPKKIIVKKTIKKKPLEGLNVLLVEDNPLNQLLAKKVLSDWKLNVEVAENGMVAIEKLKQRNFDLILMDIQMPKMDGYEATRYIRENFSPPKNTIPIIAITAHALIGEDAKCKKAGMDDYISKPFNQNELRDKINILVS